MKGYWKLRIKILLDHVSRELNFAAVIKRQIESIHSGYVEISHQDYINSIDDYDFFSKTFSGLFDILIIPSYNVKRTPEMLLRAIASKSKIVIYHSEQLFNEQFDEEKLNLNYLEQYNQHISAHLVWGEYYAKKLIEKANVNPEDIYIVGNYKFDFLSDKTKENNRKSILIASDFKLADLSDKELESFELTYDVRLPTNLNHTYLKARAKALSWVSDFSNKFPELNFVLRPHPGESRIEYKECANKCDNVILSDSTTSYSDDLNACSLVLGFTSTSVLEVINANKYMISMDLVAFDRSFLSSHDCLLDWKDKESIVQYLENLEGVNQKSFEPSPKQKKMFNEINIPTESVCNNVISACIDIFNSNDKTTTILLKDIIPITKCIFYGVGKYLLVKSSAKFPNNRLSIKVINYSTASYNKRKDEGEILDDEIINNELGKVIVKESTYKNKTITKFGWVF